jgi:hypothetical protein
MKRFAAILPFFALLAACGDLPGGAQQDMRRSASGAFTPRPEARQCLSQLGTTRASFTPLPDRSFGGGCSNINTVTLTSVRSDTSTLSLTNMGPVSCQMANGFAAWVRFGADRAARQVLGSRLARIETMGSYSCRNVAGTGRRSAHATADAIDVSGFVLADGRRITITNGWSGGTSEEREFLRVAFQSACKRFGTVLGPAYNYAHRDHLHMEVGSTSRPFCR